MNYSPRELVTQRFVSYEKCFKAEFGSYVESRTDAMVTNSKIPMRHNCTALGSLGNIQGSLSCFDLKNGSILTSRMFYVLPMPGGIVKQVNAWGMKSKR